MSTDILSETLKGLIHSIEESGLKSKPRNKEVKEAVCTSFDINPYYPIASFKERHFNWKYLAGELAWYLSRDNDIDFITNFSKFWSKITNVGTNTVNSNYGYLGLNENQLGWALKSLIEDPNSRQAVMFFNRPSFQFAGNKDFVCTMYVNFFIRGEKLYMKVQMRSNDIFYGLTYDAPFFSLLHQSMHSMLQQHAYPNLKMGDYFHHSDNTHFYEAHFDLANSIVNNQNNVEYYSFVIRDDLMKYDLEKNEFDLTNTGKNFKLDVERNLNWEKNGYNVNWHALIYKYFQTDYRIDEIIHEKNSLDTQQLSQ